MINKALILALAFMAFSSAVYANDESFVVDEVTDTQLKLAGSGLQNRKTHESLAFACVGTTPDSIEKNCDQLRMVYFNPTTQKAYYLGTPLTLSDYIPSEKAAHMDELQKRKYAMKKIMKEYKRWRHQNGGHSEETKRVIRYSIFFATFIGLSTASFFVGESVIIGLAAYPLNFVIGPMITGDLKLMSGYQRITTASYSQEGWNWSSQPRAIRPKMFDLLMNFFEKTPHQNQKYNPIRQGALE